MDKKAYVLAKKIATSAVSGVKSMSINGTVLDIETNDGDHLQMTFPTPSDGKDGKGIHGVDINANNHLIITFDDFSQVDAGEIPTIQGPPGKSGDDGFSPIVEISDEQNSHIISITDKNGTQSTTIKDGKNGTDGKSFTIKAQYASEEALIEAHPIGNAGDAYFVGSDANPDLYVWLEDDNEWFNAGQIAGIKGDTGNDGEDGVSVSSIKQTVTSDEDEGINVITVTLSNGDIFTFNIKNGSRGTDGDTVEPITSDELAAMWNN